MPRPLTMLPDERLVALQSVLDERVELAARLVSPGAFLSFADPVMRAVLTDGFERAGADEGTLWLLDEARENLVAAFNSGPHWEKMVGRFKQPVVAGIISLVLASEQPICENEVYKNQRQDNRLDRQLGVLTSTMIAAPFYFARQLRGVISCVRLQPADASAPDPPPFPAASVCAVELTANLLSRLIDHRLTMIVFGRENG